MKNTHETDITCKEKAFTSFLLFITLGGLFRELNNLNINEGWPDWPVYIAGVGVFLSYVYFVKSFLKSID